MRSVLCSMFVAMVAWDAQAQDAVDLRSAVWHGPNLSDVPVTAQIERVEVRPRGRYRTDGIVVTASGIASWPDVHAMGLGDGGGLMQYTTWICLSLDRLHCGGFVQHWRGESGQGTGAPWLQGTNGKDNWRGNWAYDGRWGPMATYVPRAGDRVFLFLSAGNTRTGQDPEYGRLGGQPFRARTNVVAFPYPAGDEGVFTFDVSRPDPDPIPVTPPPGPQVSAEVIALRERLERLEVMVEQQGNVLRAELHEATTALSGRVTILESRPVVTGCEASFFGIIGLPCGIRTQAK